MDTFYVKHNGLNDDVLPRHSVSPKIVDSPPITKTITTDQVLIPPAGKSSTALHQNRQNQQSTESLPPPTNIPPNQQNVAQTPPFVEVVGVQNMEQTESQQLNQNPLPACPQKDQIMELGDHSLLPQQEQIQIPLTAVAQDDGSQITYVDGQIRASQEMRKVLENPQIPENAMPHRECPRCATYIPPQGAQNCVLPNAPVPTSSPVHQQPQIEPQSPEIVYRNPGQPQMPPPGNAPGNSLPSGGPPCNEGDQNAARQKLNGLQKDQSLSRNITQIKHPAAAYNAYHHMRAAGVPTKYGQNYFYH